MPESPAVDLTIYICKTRNINGKVSFGRYSALSQEEGEELDTETVGRRTIMVGDVVIPSYSK